MGLDNNCPMLNVNDERLPRVRRIDIYNQSFSFFSITHLLTILATCTWKLARRYLILSARWERHFILLLFSQCSGELGPEFVFRTLKTVSDVHAVLTYTIAKTFSNEFISFTVPIHLFSSFIKAAILII